MTRREFLLLIVSFILKLWLKVLAWFEATPVPAAVPLVFDLTGFEMSSGRAFLRPISQPLYDTELIFDVPSGLSFFSTPSPVKTSDGNEHQTLDKIRPVYPSVKRLDLVKRAPIMLTKHIQIVNELACRGPPIFKFALVRDGAINGKLGWL